MKLVMVVPKGEVRLKSLMKVKERELRGKGTTFRRVKEGVWKHEKHPGRITWDESKGNVVVAVLSSRKIDNEWQLLSDFVGYLIRHFSEEVVSIVIANRP